MKRITLSMTLLLLPAVACAHDGSRVWIGTDAGAIQTYSSDDDLDPTSYQPANVFVSTLAPYFGVYTTEFPGYEVRRDGGNTPTDTLYAFKAAGPLLMLEPSFDRLRPTSQIDPTPAAPQMAVTLSTSLLITDTGVKEGFDFFSFSGVGDHAHLGFTLLGEGASPVAPVPDGVYVLPMVLTSTTLARSDWFQLVLDKNGTSVQITQAAALAQRMADAEDGDTNFDGRVDFDDLLTLAQNYGSTSGKWWATGDFDFNGAVDFDDLLTLAQQYGSGSLFVDGRPLAQSAGGAFAADWLRVQSIVPEPSLLGALVLVIARSRSRR